MGRTDQHQITKAVSQIFVHEHYDPDTTNNDITLLKLASPVTYNDWISPACLPAQPVHDNLMCYTTGFGDTLGKLFR